MSAALRIGLTRGFGLWFWVTVRGPHGSAAYSFQRIESANEYAAFARAKGLEALIEVRS